MKKITSFLMMFMLFVGMGWAQKTLPVKVSTDTEEFPYYITNEGGPSFYIVNHEKGNNFTVSNNLNQGTKQKFIFKATAEPNEFEIYVKTTDGNCPVVKDGNYVVKGDKSAIATIWRITDFGRQPELTTSSGGKLGFTIQEKGSAATAYSWNVESGNTYGNKLATWNYDVANSQWRFVYAEEIVPSELTSDGKFGEGMHWYTMSINGNTGWYRPIMYEPTPSNLNRLKYDFDAVDSRAKLYAFVGTKETGYTVYNYEAGSNMVMAENGGLVKMVAKTDGPQVWFLGQNVDGYNMRYNSTDNNNNYVNAQYEGDSPCLKFWNSPNASTDNGSRLQFIPVSTKEFQMLTQKGLPAEISEGYKYIRTKVGDKTYYLQIEKNGTFSITENRAYSFNITNGEILPEYNQQNDAYQTTGIYYLTMNGQRLSRWDKASNSFKTNVIATNDVKCRGIWHSQAILKYNGKYAIRSTNNKLADGECNTFITCDANGLKAVASTDAKEDAIYQWEFVEGSPISYSVAGELPNLYTIQIDRNQELNGRSDWFFTYDSASQKVGLNHKDAANHVNHFFYFKENGGKVQICPLADYGMVLSRLNERTEAGNVQAVNATDVEAAQWELVKGTNGSYGLKVASKNLYFSNFGGVVYNGKATNNKMGLWSDGPGTDGGSRMFLVEATDAEILAAVQPGKEAFKASFASRFATCKGKVGYPQNTEYDNLNKAVDATENSFAGYIACYDKLADFKASTNINNPVAGKAYTFTNLATNGTTKFYLNFDASTNTTSWKKTAEEATAYVCQNIGDQYVFVNNAGKYMTWFGGGNAANGYNNNKGYFDAYTPNQSVFNCEKMLQNNKNDLLFGCVALKGKRELANRQAPYFVVQNNNGEPVADGADATFFDDRGYSSAIIMEEVPYANTPKLNAIEGNMVNIAGAKKISTFSAPFATVVPQNVKAFYIKKVDKKENTAILTAIAENEAIPASQGVILAGAAEAGTNALMVPATTETVATIAIDDNALANTAGAAQELGAKAAYLLGMGTQGVGFYLNNAGSLAMNKAYLPVAGGQAQAIKLVFGDDATGIEGVEAEENADAPIYDLSGRRVVNTVKGGIYIQNGKKFIVK